MGKAFSERPRWQRWLIIGGWSVLGLVIVAAVTEREPRLRIAAMDAPDHFAMIIPEGASTAAIETAARNRCRDRPWCKVLGWTDEANAARSVPMLARESRAVVFSYFVDRPGGTEQALWSCKSFPAVPKDRCLS